MMQVALAPADRQVPGQEQDEDVEQEEAERTPADPAKGSELAHAAEDRREHEE